jgi:hypothetical protein
VFSLIATLAALLQGSTHFHRFGISLWSIAAVYWGGAAAAALIVGALKPIARYRFGAFVLGTLAGYVTYGMASLALPLPWQWWIPLIPGVLVGGGLALVWFDEG